MRLSFCRAFGLGLQEHRFRFISINEKKASAHNSLSQRLWIELGERGHENSVCVTATGEAMIAAVSSDEPDLILAPMLKIAIPEEVLSHHLSLIVHPGIKGDGLTGPSPTTRRSGA